MSRTFLLSQIFLCLANWPLDGIILLCPHHVRNNLISMSTSCPECRLTQTMETRNHYSIRIHFVISTFHYNSLFCIADLYSILQTSFGSSSNLEFGVSKSSVCGHRVSSHEARGRVRVRSHVARGRVRVRSHVARSAESESGVT